jgi:antitoxin ParD1/3/4
MPTRNVVITDHQAEMIDRMVKSGRYQNVSEALRDGLRLLQRRDAAEEKKLEALRAAARIGLEDFDAGRYRSFKTEEELRDYLDGLVDEAVDGLPP